MPRLLGIDYGQARVGLAVTDPDGRVVFPLRTVAWETRDGLFRDLLSVLEQYAVEGIVLGYPVRQGGDESLTGRQIRRFAERLGRRTSVPIRFVNEALSTEEAAERLREAGLFGKELTARVDAQAAAVILERALRENDPCRRRPDGGCGEKRCLPEWRCPRPSRRRW